MLSHAREAAGDDQAAAGGHLQGVSDVGDVAARCDARAEGWGMRYSLKYRLAAKRYKARRMRHRLRELAARVPTIADMCLVEAARRTFK